MEKKNGMAYSFKKGTNGKNVVFIHGTGCNKATFSAIVKLLPKHNCYSIDLPGHGESDDTGYTMENYVQSVADFVKDLENVILVGHSLGGTIALAVSAKNIPSVKGALVLSCGASFSKFDKEFLAKVHQGKVDKMFMIKHSGSMLNLDVLKSMTKLESDEVTIKDFLIDEVVDVTSCLKDIKIPMHIVVGADDVIALPEYSELIHKEVKGSKLTIIPGYKHMLFLAEKKKIADFIKEF